MPKQDTLRDVTTSVGLAQARRVDVWLGVASDGEILVRDVWEVMLRAADLTLECRVLTFANPTPEQLAHAVRTEIDKALTAGGLTAQ